MRHVRTLLAPLSRSFLGIALLALGARDARAVQALASQTARPVSTADSARAVKNARNAQSSFELSRRANLPIGPGSSSSTCDGIIGRICYWSNESDDTVHAPPEPQRIVQGRKRLLDALELARRDAPGDPWIVGQQVRYLTEATRLDDALTVARGCAAERSWCSALTGYVLHLQANFAAADSAFREALVAMPDDERCRWTDVNLLVDGSLADRLDHLGCKGRDTLTERIWWVATPFFLVGANDLRTEHFARMTRARMEEAARPTLTLSWGDDVREVLLRYGWDVWYTREESSFGSSLEPRVTGHPLWPSFDFFPSARAIDSMTDVKPNAWRFRGRDVRARYAPAYVKTMRPLPHQVAVSKRGDSALVVARFDVRGDTAFAHGATKAGLFLTSRPGALWQSTATFDERSGVLVVHAPWTPLLVSIEAMDTASRAVARARYGLPFPGSSGRLGVSDLVLLADGEGVPKSLEEAFRRALTTDRVSASKPLVLFWETYGVRASGERLGISLTIEETGTNLLRRAARVLRLSEKGSPVNIQWQEVPNHDTGVATRVISVDLSRITPGRYRIRLTVTPTDGPPGSASREIIVGR